MNSKKKQWLKNYNDSQKKAKSSIKKDKRTFYETIVAESVEATSNGNMKQLNDLIRLFSENQNLAGKQVKDKIGNTLTTAEEHLQRWAESFQEPLNRKRSIITADITPVEYKLSNFHKTCNEEHNKKIEKSNSSWTRQYFSWNN